MSVCLSVCVCVCVCVYTGHLPNSLSPSEQKENTYKKTNALQMAVCKHRFSVLFLSRRSCAMSPDLVIESTIDIKELFMINYSIVYLQSGS